MDKYPQVLFGVRTTRKELGDRIWELGEILEGTGMELFSGEQEEVYLGMSLTDQGGPAANAASEVIVLLTPEKAAEVAAVLSRLLDKPVSPQYWFCEIWG